MEHAVASICLAFARKVKTCGGQKRMTSSPCALRKPRIRRHDWLFSLALTPFYRFTHRIFAAVGSLLRPLWMTERTVAGVENVPLRGPAILASNHISYWDPVLIAANLPRQIFFASKAEMFDSRIVDLFFRGLDVYPIQRGTADVDAVRHMLGVLRRGDLVGLFPKGTRAPENRLQPARAGVVLLASRSKAPIIPVAITGMERLAMSSFPWLGRPRVTLTFGAPFLIEDLTREPVTAENRQALTDEVMRRIDALLPGK
jgi:1-acyl-sn-glycerol-3-phosphate acyltransferase